VIYDIAIGNGKGMDVKDLVPNPTTFRNNVRRKASSERDQLKADLIDHHDSKVDSAYTTNLWSDDFQKVSYQSIMCHYIDANFRLQIRILQVAFLII